MPLTAFSKTYRKELDASQLIEMLAQHNAMTGTVSADQIPEEWRAFIRHDLECPCCFVSGAEVVRQAVSRTTGRAVRQACFRFVEPGHHPYCDFAADANANTVPENLVSFGAENSRLTRAVRELVCSGIQLAIFDQVSIRDMRNWFFQKKNESMFKVTLNPVVPKWVHELWRTSGFATGRLPTGVELSVEIASIPGFNWKEEASRLLRERYSDILEVIRRERLWLHDLADRIATLAVRYSEQMVFDPSILKNEYQKSVTLASFISHNYAPIHAVGKPEQVATSVLALSALLLYVSDWDLKKAISNFAAVAKGVGDADKSLGNVMGLNPFHDYQAWRALKRLQELAIAVPENTDVRAELKVIEADLRSKFIPLY